METTFAKMKEPDMGQFKDLHEPANSNMTMENARELMEHRFDFLRPIGEAALNWHAKTNRRNMK